jgi:hypothetical protein
MTPNIILNTAGQRPHAPGLQMEQQTQLTIGEIEYLLIPHPQVQIAISKCSEKAPLTCLGNPGPWKLRKRCGLGAATMILRSILCLYSSP